MFSQLNHIVPEHLEQWRHFFKVGCLYMPLGGPRLRTKDKRSNQCGSRVREKRVELGLNQDQLCARIADMTDGEWMPDRLEILRIERGTRIVSDVELVAVSQALMCDPCWLLLGERETRSAPSG